jgi:ribosomal protein S18 acetylase RimI-like enzyme
LACFWAILEEAHITLLAIYPDYQRQGLGKLLLYKLLEKAVQRQLERATLEVRVSNQSAIALYEHFGFRVAGERKLLFANWRISPNFLAQRSTNGRFSGTIKQVATRNPLQTGAGRVAIRGRNQSQNRYHGDVMITYKLKSGRG